MAQLGVFRSIALPIALEINDPRYDVMLAPAHRRKWASWRSAEIRTASMKPQLKLGLSSPHPDLSRCSKTAGSSKRPPARATASRPSAIAQKSSAACRIPAVACQGVTREAEPPPLARLRPAKPVCGYSCLLGFWKSAAAQSAKALSHTSFDSEAPLKPRSSQNLAQPDRRRSRPFPRETRRGSSVGLPRKQTDPLTQRWRCRKTLRKL